MLLIIFCQLIAVALTTSCLSCKRTTSNLNSVCLLSKFVRQVTLVVGIEPRNVLTNHLRKVKLAQTFDSALTTVLPTNDLEKESTEIRVPQKLYVSQFTQSQ